MIKKSDRYFIVKEEILPEAVLKTIKAKELLAKGESLTVNEAVAKVSLSRSAFYKYKDGVFPMSQWGKGRIVTLVFFLEHRSGVLSAVLNVIAAYKGNILTINQNVPKHGLASVSLSVDTSDMELNLEELLSRIGQLNGITEIEVVGHD